MIKPWIVTPNGRTPQRIGDGRLEIIVGGDWNYWDNPIYLNDQLILPLFVEKITNRYGQGRPMHKIIVGDVEFGKHRLQLEDQYVIIFYVNPLY